MPLTFTQRAAKQLNPVFAQQKSAITAQMPAIQRLYSALFQGLEGQRRTETQNIYEGASGRGLLRSTIPIDAQTQLGQSLVQKSGELSAQQAKDLAGVRESLGSLGVSRIKAINDLSNALASRSLQSRQFKLTKNLSNREYKLQKLLADREYQLQKQALGL